MCLNGDIVYKHCLGHGGKIVIEAQYQNRPVIVKASERSVFHYYVSIEDDLLRRLSERERDKMIRDAVFRQANDVIKPFSVDNKMMTKRFLGEKNLTLADSLTLFSLLGQDEFMRLLLLTGTQHVPALYGWCGHVYAMEYITSDDFLPILYPISSRHTWEERVRVALSFLDMVKSFKNTPYGELFMCDVQESNFGITPGLIVYAIDIDLTFFTEQLKFIVTQPKCKRDDDCNFFDCVAICDKEKGKCTTNIKTNNFQVLCSDIFQSKLLSLRGLLVHPPKLIAGRLRTLLSDCGKTNDSVIPAAYYENLYDKLRDLLLHSI